MVIRKPNRLVPVRSLRLVEMALVLSLCIVPYAWAGPAQVHISQADLNPTFFINEPGTYVLTENLVASPDFSAIVVGANNVTIDLNGHRISEVLENTYGVYQAASLHGLTVKNGTISGVYSGSSAAVAAHGTGNVVADLQIGRFPSAVVLGDAATVRNITIRGDTFAYPDPGVAVQVGHRSRLESVVVKDLMVSGSFTGIVTGAESIVHRCRVLNSVGDVMTAIQTGPNSVVSETEVLSNASAGFFVPFFGVVVNSNSVLRSVSAVNQMGIGGNGILLNGPGVIVDAFASGNPGNGIHAGPGALVTRSRAHLNVESGIVLQGSSMALLNESSRNAADSGVGAGIRTTDRGNRIENNVLIGNLRGIQLDAAQNLVIGNRTSQNIQTNVLINFTPNHVGLRRSVTGVFLEKNGMANLDF